MTAPRVVLVDDDASIRRLVELALEALPIELVLCANVPAARTALGERTAALLITDMMMPGESGIDLLRSLRADPTLRGTARLAVFSAGLDPVLGAELGKLDVWRLIDKPVSTLALVDTVCEALGLLPHVEGHAVADALARPERGLCEPELDAEAQTATAHFGGDLSLFRAFREGCLAQFPRDVEAGDAACTVLDAPALRRVAHNLKSVLRLLGRDASSRLAASLEQAAAEGEFATARPLWAALRDEVQAER